MQIQKKKLISVDESDLKDGHFYNNEITEIGDNCFYNMRSLKGVHCPNVVKIGNWNFRYNAALTTLTVPLLAQCGDSNFSDNAALTTLIIGKVSYNVKNVDGSCFVIEDEKTTMGIRIYTGYNFQTITKGVIKKDTLYVAEKDGFFAHGISVKKSIQDLQFKIVAEKLKNDPIYPDTLLTVKYYRTVTGACDAGCREWMKNHKIAYRVEGDETIELNPIKAADLLPILEKSNAYGFQKFKSLLKF